jgi:hypothetical protein
MNWAHTRVGRRFQESEVDRWSAASEGVPAALRLSKSAQSADKMHFSDSTGPFCIDPRKPVTITSVLALTIDHYCA